MDLNLVKEEEVDIHETLIKVEEPPSSYCYLLEEDYFFDKPLITLSKKEDEQAQEISSQEEEDVDGDSPPGNRPHKLKLHYPPGSHKGVKKRKKSPAKSVMCEECGDSILPHFLKGHLRKHGKGYPCSHCAAEFTTNQNLIDHGKRMHADILHKLRFERTCPICKYVCKSKEDLERHSRTVHGIGKVNIAKKCRTKCGKCAELANSWDLGEVAAHKEWHQQCPPKDEDGSTIYACPYCQGGEFRSYKVMLEHKRHTHPDEGSLGGRKKHFRQVCPFCGIRCMTRDSLSRHCVSRHEGREITWDQNGWVVVVDREATSASDEEISEGDDDGEIASEVGQGQPFEINAMMMEDDPLKMIKIEAEEETETILGLDTDICDNDPFVTLSTNGIVLSTSSFQTQEEQVHSSQTIQKFDPGQITINQETSTATTIARNGTMIFTTTKDSTSSQNVHRQEEKNNQTEIDSDDERFLDQLEFKGQEDAGSSIKVEEDLKGPSHQHDGHLSNYGLMKEEENDDLHANLTNLDDMQYKVEVCEDNIFL